MKFIVTLQYANRAQFTPNEPRPDGIGYRMEQFEAESAVAAARLCYEKYREQNLDNIMVSGVPLDFAIVIETSEVPKDAAEIEKLYERVETIPAAEIIGP